MAWILESFIVNPDDEVVMMSHRFFGHTQAECKSTYDEHVQSCEYFKAAINEGRTQEEWLQIPEEELPYATKADK
jgi:hypothetical protein